MNINLTDVLSSFDKTKAFFDSSPDIDNIRELAKNEQKLAHTRPYYDRWHVCLIVITAPFKIVTLFVVSYIESICSLVPSLKNTLGNRCTVLTRHIYYYTFKKAQNHFTYGNKLLTTSINTHQIATAHFFNHKPIPRSQIKDITLHRAAFRHHSDVRFRHFKGVCRGIGTSVIHLYLKTHHLFTSRIAHMRAIGKQFEAGASCQAAMIQSFNSLDQAVWGINSQESLKLSSFTDIENSPGACQTAFKRLSPGAYSVYLYRHQIDLFIEDDLQSAFIFDANKGMINISGPDRDKDLYEFIRTYHNNAYDPLDRFMQDVYFNLCN